MRIRRIASAVVTFVVAITVAIAMPVSQLRTVETVSAKCCCPDPTNCHCPPQSPDSDGAQLQSCHRVSHDIVAPQLPAFSPPEVALAQPELIVVASLVLEPAAPHPAPASRRPDAPS